MAYTIVATSIASSDGGYNDDVYWVRSCSFRLSTPMVYM